MIKITLEYATLDDAITALATIRNPAAAPKATVEAPAAPKQEADKPGKSATTDKPAAGKPDAKAGPSAAAEKKEPASSASATAGDAYEPVGAAIKKAAATHRAETIALLAEYNAKSGKDLKVEDYPAFMEKLAAVTSGGDLG